MGSWNINPKTGTLETAKLESELSHAKQDVKNPVDSYNVVAKRQNFSYISNKYNSVLVLDGIQDKRANELSEFSRRSGS